MQQFFLAGFFFLISFLYNGQGNAQSPVRYVPKNTDVFYKLGETIIIIKVQQYGTSRDAFFINLHDDELTAIAGAVKLLEQQGGTLVRIDNQRNRNIRFRLDGRCYAFDPNRIFSRTRIIQTLRTFGPISNKAIGELQKFAARVLELLPPPPTCVISLHNNYDGKFSITSYQKGNEREKDARALHIVPYQDPDNLFLTTDSSLFQTLKKENFNAVWQDNRKANKDGSLSVYCGEKNICYLNCETEHGKFTQYANMIAVAFRHVRKSNPAPTGNMAINNKTVLYKYHFIANSTAGKLPSEFEIYFGEKKIGQAKSISPGGQQAADAGQMEIINTFPLYDNMDFFFFTAQPKKIELRIDPTRTRNIVDPAKMIIPVKVMQ